MADAVRMHGVVRGVGIGIRRLARCHPFGGYGYDPVPPVTPRPDQIRQTNSIPQTNPIRRTSF
jgi:putative component of membrane protein insertase Oxa1/YidC/SpoIIIJ protein YidD